MNGTKKPKAAEVSKNSNQTGARGPKGHGNHQQRSFHHEQDTRRDVERGNNKNVHDDAVTTRSQPSNCRNETGHEDMDTSQNDAGQQYTITCEGQQPTTHGAGPQPSTYGAGRKQTIYRAGQQHTTYGARKKRTTYGVGDHYTTYDAGQQYTTYDTDRQATKELKLLELQRSLEASKQMINVVYGNVITILEEYETREMAHYQLKQKMPKSKIHIPKQSHKTLDDVKSIVETQLLLFKTQTKVCPPEALAEVREDLKRRTISWLAVREEMGIKEVHVTDFYITKLYEILATGKYELPSLQKEEVSTETMRKGFQAILQGDHDRENLDREFKTNKDKKASAPETRGSENLRAGADRISRARGIEYLDKFLEDDLKTFENEGPTDLK